jgi:hypothetical protein
VSTATFSELVNRVNLSFESFVTTVEETIERGMADKDAVIISVFLYESLSYSTALGGTVSSNTKSLETPE